MPFKIYPWACEFFWFERFRIFPSPSYFQNSLHSTPAAPSRQVPLLPRKRSWRSSPMHWPRRLPWRPSSRPRCLPRRQPAPTPPLTPNAATVDSASSTSESMPRRCRCRHHSGPTRWTPPWRLDVGRRRAGQKRPVRGTGVTEAWAAASCRVGRAPP